MSGDERDKRPNGEDSAPLVLEDDGLFGQYEEKKTAGDSRQKGRQAEQPPLRIEDIDEKEIDELLNIEASDSDEPPPLPERISTSRLMDLAALLEKGPPAESPGPPPADRRLPQAPPPVGLKKGEAGAEKPIPGLFSQGQPASPSTAPPAAGGEPGAGGSESEARDLLSELLSRESEPGLDEAFEGVEAGIDELEAGFEEEVEAVTEIEESQTDEAPEEARPAAAPAEGTREAIGDEHRPAPGKAASAAGEEKQPVAAPSEPALGESMDRAMAEAGIESAAEPEYREVSRPSEIPISGSGLLTMALTRRPFPDDQGAEAAKRTIRHRAGPAERAPLVGSGAEVDRSRMALLEHLAEGSSGPVRSRLLVAAAEIGEALGEEQRAYELYATARQADPNDAVAVREARKRAMSREEWALAVELLAAEAGLPLGPAERALVLTALAELRLRRLDDPGGARQAAAEALQTHPRCLSAALLLREIELGENRPAEAADALGRVESRLTDAQMRAALLLEAGRILERDGRAAEAQVFFQRCADVDDGSIGARLGLARSARAAGDVEVAVKALLEIGRLAEPGPVRDEIVRTAARYAHFLAGRPQQAYELLQNDESVPALRARARAAEASGDRESFLSVLRSWAEKSEGSERALALFELGRARAAGGEMQEADQALAEAYAADSSLGIIVAMREMIARQTGDASGLARAAEGGPEAGALRAAAKLVRSGEREKQERELLARACQQAESPLTAEAIAVDTAAEANDLGQVREALLRAAGRAGEGQGAGSLLAWMDLGRAEAAGNAGGQQEQPELATETQEKRAEVLREAREAAAASPGVIRRIARYARDPFPAADLWLQEAASAQGQYAAFAARQAGRLLEASGGDAIGAYRKALESAPGHGPSCWALDRAALVSGDRHSSILAHEQLAGHAAEERERAKHLVLAALLEVGEDDRKASALLAQASGLFPDDSVLKQLMLRITDTSQPERFAEMLLQSAEGAPPAWSRAARLRAASVYEDGGQPEKAAELYQTALQGPGDADPFASLGLDRARLAAGQVDLVFERLERGIEQADGEQARQAALLERARLGLDRAETGEAVEQAAGALLDLGPGYLPAHRALERHHMKEANAEALREVAGRILGCLTQPVDVAAYLRWVARLTELQADSPLEKSDELVLREAGRAEPDFWVNHHLEAAARRAGDEDRVVEALERVAALYSNPVERGSIALRRAEILESRSSLQAAESLQAVVSEAPDHPVAAEELGRLYEVAGEHVLAAEAFEAAARAESSADRRARLWHRAGALWQDEVEDKERAAAALGNIGSQDPLFRDTFARLRVLLGEKGEAGRLVGLVEQRLQAEADRGEQIRLHVELSRLHSESGDREAAKKSLSTAAGLDPQNAEVLRGLAEFFLQDRQWEQATGPLIALARLARENEQLIWAFMRLGEIYDSWLPDLGRAEAAFGRVVGLDAEHVEAIERLVDIFRRQGQLEKAVRALQRLLQLGADAESKRGYLLQMAAFYEALGKTREAEQMMQACRQEAPTDLRVVRALAGFYRRQKADAALSVHLNLTCNEFRNAVSSDPSGPEGWKGLVEILDDRGYRRAARCCASTARAVGVTDAGLGALLDDARAAAPCTKALRNRSIDQLIAPPLLSETARLVFQGVAPALESVLPLDLERFGASKLKSRPEGTNRALGAVCEWFGLKQVSTYRVPARLCLPVSVEPLTILIGEPLLEEIAEAGQLFLFARAAKIAHEGLCPVVRSRLQELGFAVNALVRHFDGSFEPKGVNLEKLDELARRIGKLIPRRVHEALGPSVYEMAGAPGFDPALLPAAALEAGTRSALVATGDSSAALAALLALGGSGVRVGRPGDSIKAIREQPEASALLTFALSDIFFEACQKAQDIEGG